MNVIVGVDMSRKKIADFFKMPFSPGHPRELRSAYVILFCFSNSWMIMYFD